MNNVFSYGHTTVHHLKMMEILRGLVFHPLKFLPKIPPCQPPPPKKTPTTTNQPTSQPLGGLASHSRFSWDVCQRIGDALEGLTYTNWNELFFPIGDSASVRADKNLSWPMQLGVCHHNLVEWQISQPLEYVLRIEILEKLGSSVTVAFDQNASQSRHNLY